MISKEEANHYIIEAFDLQSEKSLDVYFLENMQRAIIKAVGDYKQKVREAIAKTIMSDLSRELLENELG